MLSGPRTVYVSIHTHILYSGHNRDSARNRIGELTFKGFSEAVKTSFSDFFIMFVKILPIDNRFQEKQLIIFY